MSWNEVFEYNPSTGELSWRVPPATDFKSPKLHAQWIKRCVGKRVGRIVVKDHCSYVDFKMRGKIYQAHRVIWEMHYGPIPEGMQIDHRDNDGSNNRLDNLRLATQSQNMMNKRGRARCGFKGVRVTPYGKYYSGINVDGKYTHLGNYDTPEEASAAYKKAAIEMHGDFANFTVIPK